MRIFYRVLNFEVNGLVRWRIVVGIVWGNVGGNVGVIVSVENGYIEICIGCLVSYYGEGYYLI